MSNPFTITSIMQSKNQTKSPKKSLIKEIYSQKTEKINVGKKEFKSKIDFELIVPFFKLTKTPFLFAKEKLFFSELY
jgi:hypothetical protein